MKRAFGESTYPYAWTIQSLHPYMAEPVNAITALWITVYAFLNNHARSPQQRLALWYITLNGLASCYMHMYLPDHGTSIIAALDFGTMLGVVFEMSGWTFVHSSTIVILYVGYNVLGHHAWVEMGLDHLFSYMTFYIMLKQVIVYKNYTTMCMCLMGAICQIVDNELYLDDMPVIKWFRMHFPLHAMWHLLFGTGSVRMILGR